MIFVITILLLSDRAFADDIEIPDYFASAKGPTETPRPAQSNAGITIQEVKALIDGSDQDLRQLAAGNRSAATAFASLFDASVDYYDQGAFSPTQIAAEKADIFTNYSSYATEFLGNPTIQTADESDTIWVYFTYRYQIQKKTGKVLQGTADARWKIRKVGDRLRIIAVKESTHRR